jgi:hypothetical protein
LSDGAELKQTVSKRLRLSEDQPLKRSSAKFDESLTHRPAPTKGSSKRGPTFVAVKIDKHSEDRFGSILLKKSGRRVDVIFLALWVRFS